MTTATLEPIRVYKPEQLDGPATVNAVKTTDKVSYFAPLAGQPGLYFVVVRNGLGKNPRTFILTGAQLHSLDPRPSLMLARNAA